MGFRTWALLVPTRFPVVRPINVQSDRLSPVVLETRTKSPTRSPAGGARWASWISTSLSPTTGPQVRHSLWPSCSGTQCAPPSPSSRSFARTSHRNNSRTFTAASRKSSAKLAWKLSQRRHPHREPVHRRPDLTRALRHKVLRKLGCLVLACKRRWGGAGTASRTRCTWRSWTARQSTGRPRSTSQ